MNNPVKLLIGSSVIFIYAFILLVVAPYIQMAAVKPEVNLKPYTEQQLRGRAVYVKYGCVYCHSQQPRSPLQAPDHKKQWGRPSTPGDYAYDYPHLLGTMRTGPDLFNIGVRQPSKPWHLLHLYQPRSLMKWSIMAPFPFLFEFKQKPRPDDVVVKLPPKLQKQGFELVAKQDAVDLVEYLVSLKRNYPSLKQIEDSANETSNGK